MKRPTISDLAKASGVSLSTVNRLIHGSGKVREDTIDRIARAADEIGFYGLSMLNERKKESLKTRKFGILLQQSHRPLYPMLADAFVEAAQRRTDYLIKPKVQFENDLAPDVVAKNLLELGKQCDAIAVITPDHPLINQAIDQLTAQNVPVVTYITDLSSAMRAGYVGTHNWQLGRTAAWLVSSLAQEHGMVASLIGNHRYQCQDTSDASFRAYFRERAPQFSVSEALPTHEEPDNAYQIISDLARTHDDLVGVFVAGGGISGVLRALEDIPPARRDKIKVVCRDIGPETRKGLSEHRICAALCHPLQSSSDALIDTMLRVVGSKHPATTTQTIVPFEIFTPENV